MRTEVHVSLVAGSVSSSAGVGHASGATTDTAASAGACCPGSARRSTNGTGRSCSCANTSR